MNNFQSNFPPIIEEPELEAQRKSQSKSNQTGDQKLGKLFKQVHDDIINELHKEISHRHYEDDNEWGCGSWFEYTVVVVLASVLLLGSLALTLYWVVQYKDGFAWTENPRLQFNLHPVLMVAGFITFSGFSILLYRICRCCRRIYVKLLHTVFHALAIPCVAIGFIAVLDSHNLNQPPIPNFYSLHSWIGLVTMGLFAIQFVVGFFSFLILLCCEGATAGFRSALVPIHASFGLTTFMLAIAACVSGLTEKALFDTKEYPTLSEEGIVINTLGACLIALGILVSFAVRSPNLQAGSGPFMVKERI